MARLQARELLEMWDQGRHRQACDCAVLLLEKAMGQSHEDLAALSLDLRNGELLKIRQSLLGSTMEVFDRCPACQTQVEFTVAIPTLLALVPKEPESEMDLAVGDYYIRYRPPNSWDLGAVAQWGYSKKGGTQLFRNLILDCSHAGEAIAPETLPEEVEVAVADHLQQARPLTEIVFTLTCPEAKCAHRWRTTLDIAGFIWREIQTQAQLLLHQIHRLACGYGWSETDILALSGPRRRFYLELLNA